MSILYNCRLSLLTVPRSVVRWIAYWTIGFEMTTNWYWRRIRQNLNRAARACQAIVPQDRTVVYKYLEWGIFRPLDTVVGGLRGARGWDSIRDWDQDQVFSKFKDYVVAEEKRLKITLRRLSYDIRQDNTLHILMRRGRPEKVCLGLMSCITVYNADLFCKYALPLLCLLLERVVWTMDVARHSLVSPNEFILLAASIRTVMNSMHTRANKLQGQEL